MLTAFNKFLMLIERNRQLADSIYLLKSQVTVTFDLSDVYRTQVVSAFSALDFLIHEIVRIGILEQFEGKRAKTAEYEDFFNKLNMPENLSTFDEKRVWLETEIVRIHSWKSFQQSRKISDALKKILDQEYFWNTIANAFETTPDFLKKDLDIKVRRRNQIVHEGDINPTYGTLWDISDKDSCDIVDFIERFGCAMQDILI